jgi:hypothetical protein
MKTRSSKTAFMMALTICLLCGCHQIRDEYTINPDASGKVKISRLAPAGFNMMGSKKDLDPDAEALKVAKKLVESSRGVEAWKDFTWKVANDGRIQLSGTAFFKNLAELKLGEGGSLLLKKNDGASMILGMAKEKKRSSGKAGKPAPALTGQALKKKILAEKVKWQQARGMLTAMLSGMEMTTTVKLPGKVTKVSCFKKSADDTVSISFKGDDFLKAIKELTAQDSFWQAQVTSGSKMEDMESPELLEKLFGSRTPPEVVITKNAASLFDYAQEVAAAKKSMPELMKKLGASSNSGGAPEVEIAPASAGAGLSKVWVTKITQSLKTELPKNKGLWSTKPSCQLSIIGELPGKVMDIKNGAVTKAIADNGVDLLLEGAHDKKTQSAYLQGSQKAFVSFSVKLKALPEGTKSIKEISGNLVYSVGSGSKKVSLGEIKLEKDATGKILKAKVTQFNKSYSSMTLEVDIKNPNTIKSITCKGPDGAELKTKLNYSNTWGGKSRLSLKLPKDPPASMTVEIETYEKTEKRSMPFKIENVKIR